MFNSLITLMLLMTLSSNILKADENGLTTEQQKKLNALFPKKSKKSKQRFPEPFVKIAVDGIKEYPEVVDAAVNQKSSDINLVVVVRQGTPKEKAKEMGDNFLRILMANSMGIENSPKKEIGPTKFSYLIGIYYPGEIQAALGAKAPASRAITW